MFDLNQILAMVSDTLHVTAGVVAQNSQGSGSGTYWQTVETSNGQPATVVTLPDANAKPQFSTSTIIITLAAVTALIATAAYFTHKK